jgi:hypothetical protein
MKSVLAFTARRPIDLVLIVAIAKGTLEMTFLLKLTRAHASLARLLDSCRWLFLMFARGYLGWAFWQSGSGWAIAFSTFVVAGVDLQERG